MADIISRGGNSYRVFRARPRQLDRKRDQGGESNLRPCVAECDPTVNNPGAGLYLPELAEGRGGEEPRPPEFYPRALATKEDRFSILEVGFAPRRLIAEIVARAGCTRIEAEVCACAPCAREASVIELQTLHVRSSTCNVRL